MSKKLGIDLGSSSLGWYLRDGNKRIGNGVIIFDTGMTKDKGGYTSPTKNRREARSKRRLIQSRKYRKNELLKILIEYNLVPLSNEELFRWNKYIKGQPRIFPESQQFKKWLACDFTYLENGKKYKNPYELRAYAIDNKVSKHEFGRVLYNIVQRRGYKDIGEKDSETQKQIERREGDGLKTALNKHVYLSKALQNEFIEKGERARNQYPYRQEYELELLKICETQGCEISKNINSNFNNDFVKKVWKSIIWQRPLQSQKGNIGKCSFEPSKFRCSTSHPVFEIYRTWTYLNTIKTVEYLDDKHSIKKDIPLEYKKNLFEKVFLKQSKNFKFETIQKHLDRLFKESKEYNYLNRNTGKYDSPISGMPVCKSLIDIFGDKVKQEIELIHTYNIGTNEHNIVNNYSIYDIWHLIFTTDNEHLEDFAIKKLGVDTVIKQNKNGEVTKKNPIVELKKSAFTSSYTDLSIKAINKIIPFLKEGFVYNQAVLLAKMPELYKDWEKNKNIVYEIIKNANENYNYYKDIVEITNKLIDKYKSTDTEKFAYKDYDYILKDSDYKEIENACISHYGEKTWKEKDKKEIIIKQVAYYYQSFFADTLRKYIKQPTLSNILKEELLKNNITFDINKLYHHSDKKNIYLQKLKIDKETDTTLLPIDFKTKKTILPGPIIDSIKNPMFNKSMSILKKFINELIVKEYVDSSGITKPYIDENTEIIIEVARELNDNNMRIAIEKYQRERRENREKYRQFINEFKERNKDLSNLNTEEKIPVFELWNEQIFESPTDKKNINKNTEILKERNAIKRYELWSEQKGLCMYTGKMISISQLFSNEVEIEHTIPRSLLPDNTMANLTVCFSKYNSDIKNNKIPAECPNYETDTIEGTAIKPRLKQWIKIKDHYKKQYENNLSPKGFEDENSKNIRIQKKHYYKMHYDYWYNKINRFTTEEIKDSWVRRQLTDTQMVSKYAREYLKTYFKKVTVQKGSTTADFRKIYKFQPENEIKNRNKHTHHSIDAAVLTLIPTNSSKRMELLNKFYKSTEKNKHTFHTNPEGLTNFNSQKLIEEIENNTLIVNYTKDKITKQTFKNIRKRGKLQYLKKNGKYILDKNGQKIPLKAKGTTIRGQLFQETFIGKVKSVERDYTGKPLRNNDGSWKFLTGKQEFNNVVRKPITEAKIEDIVDPFIKSIIEKQLSEGKSRTELKDHQGNTIRHIRVRVRAGKIVKERLNYKSKYNYKNKYYAAAGEIPYAIFITNLKNGRIERQMIPVAIHEIAQTFRKFGEFTPELHLQAFYPEIKEYQDIKLLKIGQKVFVLNDDKEFDKRKDFDFQVKRMYKITQFFVDGEGGIYLKYHLEATKDDDIDKMVKEKKHLYLKKYDDEFGLPEIIEDTNEKDLKKRKKDYQDAKYKFVGLKDNRFKRLIPFLGEEKVKEIKKELDKFKKQSSKIEKEGETPLLKKSIKDCNFIIENYDFRIDLTGKITWLV